VINRECRIFFCRGVFFVNSTSEDESRERACDLHLNRTQWPMQTAIVSAIKEDCSTLSLRRFTSLVESPKNRRHSHFSLKNDQIRRIWAHGGPSGSQLWPSREAARPCRACLGHNCDPGPLNEPKFTNLALTLSF